jgi:D-sedoheptulose 7-phosphate isomerase
MTNQRYIEEFLHGVEEIARSVSRADIDQAIEILFQAWQEERMVFTIGNGGSAGTASHFAADLNKMTAFPGCKRMRVMSLVDNMSLFSALVNDEGWENVYVEQLEHFFRPGDVLIAISVHGGSGKDKAGAWSQNLLKAIRYVKDRGGTTIGLAGFDGGAMKELADVCVVVPYRTTPHVEGFHVVLHHLVAFCLAEKIGAHEGCGILRS